jgi:regulator of replication initiation timing
MVYRDLEKRRKWYREYYHAHKQKKTVREQLIEENEKLKTENAELRKQLVLLKCPNCDKKQE